MIIVTSAAYINQEFSSEFGLIPPAFLPVGNRRLFTYQIDSLPDTERRILTVPDSYSVSRHDCNSLEALGVEIQHIPPNLSLGESVVCAVNLSGSPPDEPLRILHGDTLIGDLPGDRLDVITLSEVDGAYNWATWHEDGDELLTQLDDSPMVGSVKIANGYFAFADCGLFVRSVIRAAGSFISGVNAYARERHMDVVEVDEWLDFGHGHTFYRSKARMTTQRSFNSLTISPQTVRKSSADSEKMLAERHWFESLPADLKVFAPQLIRNLEGAKRGYELQYLYLVSLNELYVFGMLPRFVWRKIFQACFAFLGECRRHRPPEPLDFDVSTIFLGKTLRRLSRWADATGTDLERGWIINGTETPGLIEIARRTAETIPMIDEDSLCVVHGDFCFSNVLYDFRAQAVKVIDPRGRIPDGTISIYGDRLYDLAKLAHSVCGLYDFIISGYFSIAGDGHNLTLELPCDSSIAEVQAVFVDMVKETFDIDARVLTAMQIHLFLSMLPLHSDEPGRQRAFLANALRLYVEHG